MFYPFPYIKHISQVTEALHGRDEFIITEKPGGYTVANYLVNFEDTFPPIKLDENGKYASKQDELYAIRRECRGIKFDTETGLVIARTLHKFFNVNEREETQVKDVLGHATWILEKLDGSMIHPILLHGTIRWCTKMGLTEVAIPVETFAYNNPDYNKFAQHCIDINHTPIFEWCSRTQRIVIDYPEDKLTLIAIRENYSGRYLSMDEMAAILYKVPGVISAANTIPIVKTIHSFDLIKIQEQTDAVKLQEDLDKIKTDDGLIDIVRQQETGEGYVFRMYNGHMLKVKSEWYCKVHKSKDKLRWEKDIIDLIVNEKLDDVKPFLSEYDLKRINDYENAFWLGVNKFIKTVKDKFYFGKTLAGNDKKKFAVDFALLQNSIFKQLMFQLWDGKDVRDCVIALIKNNVGSQTTVDGIRHVFNCSWIVSSDTSLDD